MSDKPLVSFIIFSYKQEQFIREAVRGALAQKYEPLEIIISDDCSPDNTFEIIEEETFSYAGPHKIILNRNAKNLGLPEHMNKVFQMAKGQFIVGNAGDDISFPQRTSVLVKRWLDKSDPVDLVCSSFEEIDISGHTTNEIKPAEMFFPDTRKPVYKWRCGATGATSSFDRKLFEAYGPLDKDIIAEDWIFAFRAWVSSGVAMIEEPLVKRRVHDESISRIFKNVQMERKRNERYKLRKKLASGRRARAREWYNTLRIADAKIDNNIDKKFKNWIKLTEIEVNAYEESKYKVLLSLLKAMRYPGGFRVSARMLVRNLMGIQ